MWHARASQVPSQSVNNFLIPSVPSDEFESTQLTNNHARLSSRDRKRRNAGDASLRQPCSSPISSTASSTPSMPSMDPVTQALSSKKRKTASTVSSRASTPLVPNSSVPGEAKAARKPRAKTNRPSSKARKHKKAAAAAAAKEEEVTGEVAVSGSTSGTAESDPEEMVVDPGKDDFDDLALEDGVVQQESTVDGGELFFMDDVRRLMKHFSPF